MGTFQLKGDLLENLEEFHLTCMPMCKSRPHSASRNNNYKFWSQPQMQIQHITRKDGEKMTVEVKFFTRDLENSWGWRQGSKTHLYSLLVLRDALTCTKLYYLLSVVGNILDQFFCHCLYNNVLHMRRLVACQGFWARLNRTVSSALCSPILQTSSSQCFCLNSSEFDSQFHWSGMSKTDHQCTDLQFNLF